VFDGMTSPARSAREIAAKVKPGARLLAAEDELRSIKTRVGEIAAETKRLAGAGDPANDRALVKLDTERAALLAKLGPLRRTTVEMRVEHGLRVRGALGPAIATAAASAHSAALELRAALGSLADINAALAQAHADPIWLPQPPGIDALVERAARLAGRGS